jgi:hypothetical protein
METELITYIRDDNNAPRGVAVAILTDGTVSYGFSLLNTRQDKWDKGMGVKIALRRAFAPTYQLPVVPERKNAVMDAFKRLERRAIRYFKDIDPSDIRLMYSDN